MRKVLEGILKFITFWDSASCLKKDSFTAYKKLLHIRMNTLEIIFAVHGHVWNIL